MIFPIALVLAAASLAVAPPSKGPVLPFLEDDYNKALSLALEMKVPIFVDAWAPW